MFDCQASYTYLISRSCLAPSMRCALTCRAGGEHGLGGVSTGAGPRCGHIQQPRRAAAATVAKANSCQRCGAGEHELESEHPTNPSALTKAAVSLAREQTLVMSFTLQ